MTIIGDELLVLHIVLAGTSRENLQEICTRCIDAVLTQSVPDQGSTHGSHCQPPRSAGQHSATVFILFHMLSLVFLLRNISIVLLGVLIMPAVSRCRVGPVSTLRRRSRVAGRIPLGFARGLLDIIPALAVLIPLLDPARRQRVFRRGSPELRLLSVLRLLRVLRLLSVRLWMFLMAVSRGRLPILRRLSIWPCRGVGSVVLVA